ncbi:MAG: 23S rRNA (pseudouridine(1915)-N(3))-methyltransferase RlmH [Prevotella sp.]|nr:23S rRNA (pseudouridine(1915)-N(3))-methyltransferase RlmH [Bacteroides sp.]MCM1365802.1 23S rRNA (pseudouridine(1915)-N(3))-methyltransferase RlmH [Prevotella sp.]MCM1436506.1 23S rRNA (pseudouridine(1915)-N(3))-methyltransferase RlmH [Prevotella sp.]
MDITLICVGKTSISFIKEGVNEYMERLIRYVPFENRIVPDVKNARKLTEKMQKETEGKQILSCISPSDWVILLDERGKQFSSTEFAEFLQGKMVSGLKRLVFIIGGPYGFSPEVYSRANGKMSLSKMTFNHEMVRMFFIEQIYRAMTILRGEPYHHE